MNAPSVPMKRTRNPTSVVFTPMNVKEKGMEEEKENNAGLPA